MRQIVHSSNNLFADKHSCYYTQAKACFARDVIFKNPGFKSRPVRGISYPKKFSISNFSVNGNFTVMHK